MTCPLSGHPGLLTSTTSHGKGQVQRLALVGCDDDIVVGTAKLLAPNHPFIDGLASATAAVGVAEPAGSLNMTLALVHSDLS